MNETARKIGERFKKAESIWLASHIRPDGDAIGSLLGLGLALENAGKQVTMLLIRWAACQFSIPARLKPDRQES